MKKMVAIYIDGALASDVPVFQMGAAIRRNIPDGNFVIDFRFWEKEEEQ